MRGAANGVVSSHGGLKVGPGVSMAMEEAYRGGHGEWQRWPRGGGRIWAGS